MDEEQPIVVKLEQLDQLDQLDQAESFLPSSVVQTEPTEKLCEVAEVKLRSLEELYRDSNLSWQNVDLDFQDKDAPDKEDFEDIFQVFKQAKELNKVKVEKLARINNELRNYNERLNDATGK